MRSSLNSSASFSEYLIALELLCLNSHLSIAIFALGLLDLKLGNGRFEALALLALLAATRTALVLLFVRLVVQTLAFVIDVYKRQVTTSLPSQVRCAVKAWGSWIASRSTNTASVTPNT